MAAESTYPLPLSLPADVSSNHREPEYVIATAQALPDDLPEPTAGLREPTISPDAALVLAGRLQEHREWARARQVLQAAESSPGVTPAQLRRLRQQRVICTYKDSELRLLPALEHGLAVLATGGENLATTTDPETLGIAGAIHKRMWEVSGRRAELVVALGFYLRGSRCSNGSDLGYNAVNAAFLLDTLAALDERTAAKAALRDDSETRRSEHAAELRRGVLREHRDAALKSLKAPRVQDWWLVATVAEAALGLDDYATARELLAVRRQLTDLPDWQLESTARQLARLAQLREASGGEAAAVVAELTGRPASQLQAITGRVGLALSGGGFRASFFHLGVLARLAELDVLRHVEVLSCVSGGSIVGAHYYLELRRRMQAKRDEEMTRDEYVDIVRTVQRAFCKATNHNLRWRALTNPIALARTLFEPGYNRTTRVGQLLDRWFYEPLLDGEAPVLGHLGITPVDSASGLDPRQQNWRRSAKVPLLILNATTLNTGHNWQFTSSWMGEPYGFIDDRTDANYRLGRVRLGGANARGAVPITMGQAVAASASVPGLLEPLHLDGVYPTKNVRLADGGVMDNEGIYGLLAEDCTIVLISDASGQMNAQDHPKSRPWSTMMRSNSILMATVRSTSFRELDELRSSGRLHSLLYLHLKRDLRAALITPGIDPPAVTGVDAGRTSYGMPRTVQRALAGLRTDLDAFSPAEAFTLMLSGYRMTTEAAPLELPNFPLSGAPPVDWPFRVVEHAVDAPAGSRQADALAQLLRVPLPSPAAKGRMAPAVPG